MCFVYSINWKSWKKANETKREHRRVADTIKRIKWNKERLTIANYWITRNVSERERETTKPIYIYTRKNQVKGQKEREKKRNNITVWNTSTEFSFQVRVRDKLKNNKLNV